MRWLTKFGLRFGDRSEERAFLNEFVTARWRYLQAAMILGGFVYYVFFLWDRIVDPIHADIAHIIRAVIVVCVLWAGAASLNLVFVRERLETILLVYTTVPSIGLSIICVVLTNGFDFGAPGLIVIILFVFSLLQMRILYLLAFCLLSWGSFALCELLFSTGRPGLFLLNSMCIGAAVSLGLFSAVMRERAARLQFRTERQLRTSRQRVEDLLHSMLPEEIVRRIQAGETVIADAHGEVSIVFADLVGFTELSRRMSPRQIIEILNRLFSSFDAEAERHGIDRIKTIGDAYMAVGGLGSGSANHAEDAANFALALQGCVSQLSKDLDVPISIRVGLHVGPVVAGVIGTKRPAFDCWGEAVNVASRLESTATPGGVLISESAYWRLRERFAIRSLTDVALKGIGPTKVFLLEAAA
ncbi:MAG TPA: adenylate/guanylate cyclase domain-containing protein [Methylobacterium sp.]